MFGQVPSDVDGEPDLARMGPAERRLLFPEPGLPILTLGGCFGSTWPELGQHQGANTTLKSFALLLNRILCPS